MYRPIGIIAIILLLPYFVFGKIPEFIMGDELDGKRITNKLTVFKTEDSLQIDSAWQNLSRQGVPDHLKFGFSDSFYWLGFTAINQSGSDLWILEIENPHIDYVDVYVRAPDTNQWVLTEQTGDKTPFHTRTIAHYNYAIPLEFDRTDTLDVAVKLNKIPTSMNYHSVLWSAESFSSYQQVQYVLNGLYFGIFAMVILAAAIAFVFSGTLIYLWYMLFVLASGMFVLSDTGLAFQFLYPWSETLNNYTRVYLAFCMAIFFILFTQNYFSTRSRMPFTHSMLNGTLAGLILLLIPVVIVPEWVSGVVNIFLPILYFLILTAICLTIYTAVMMIKSDASLAVFYLSAFIFILAGSVVTILVEFGLITDLKMRFTPIQIATGVEIMILTGAMAWRINKVYEHQFELNSKINRLEARALRSHIDGIEEERRRVAMSLHDSIGNHLASLKRKAEIIAPSLLDAIKQITDEVRTISHQLSPIGIKLTGLKQKVQQFINETNEYSSISYRFHCIDLPEKLPVSFKIEIYRIIQESVNNIEKHSQAKKAEIQIMGHGNQIVITIEDDGIGLPDSRQESEGIGLQNIKQRVKILKGTIEVTSRKNRGVQFLIEIPVPERSSETITSGNALIKSRRTD